MMTVTIIGVHATYTYANDMSGLLVILSAWGK
jgi:hypothetical protein